MGKPIFIRDLPTEDRPRERLLKHGADKLSNQEILSILIGSGSKNDPVQLLADRILMHFEGIKLLRDATVEELTAIKGIGVAKSLNILAAMELGKRISSYKSIDTYMIRSPEDGANYVMEEMRNLAQEHFVALFLNTKKSNHSSANPFYWLFKCFNSTSS